MECCAIFISDRWYSCLQAPTPSCLVRQIAAPAQAVARLPDPTQLLSGFLQRLLNDQHTSGELRSLAILDGLVLLRRNGLLQVHNLLAARPSKRQVSARNGEHHLCSGMGQPALLQQGGFASSYQLSRPLKRARHEVVIRR